MNARIYLNNGLNKMMKAKSSEEVQSIYEKAMSSFITLVNLQMLKKEDYISMAVELFDYAKERICIIEEEA